MRSKHGNICGGKKPVDTQALRKKVSSVTCGPAARAILSSLLLYITDLQDRPPELPPARMAAGGKSRAGRSPGSQNGQQRPTCFQLLQAKFMGTGREPRLKKPREVGRLISKDKQGPGRSLVTATISKLLEKAREGASRPPQDRERPHSQKPRQGLPAGKGTVKNILKMFLAAEEKEVREEPRAARAPLPKLATKRGSVLSKLREKFEQSGCLCSEAKVLPLRAEGRKKNLQRRRTHLPESHVLRTTTMASTCIRTPLACFLACTAEPVLAFSIATVICGPRSWLSHCAKISHSQQGRVPSMGGMAPRGVRTAGQGQPGAGPAQPPASWAMAPADSPETGFLGGGPPPIPGPAPSPASHRSGALPGSEPLVSLLKPASPEHAGAVRGDRTGDPPTGDTAQHTGAPGEARMGLWPGLPGAGAGMAPEVALTVCSSEDETEGVTLGLEGDPLFAVQETFPEQKVAGHVLPLLLSTVQALRCTQSAVGSPQVTVARPDTRQMSPPPATLPKAVGSPQVTVARPHTRQMSPPPATLPKAVGPPQVTVARPDTRQMSPPPATLPKAVGSPQVTVARPDTRQMSPPPATLPKALGGGDKSSSLLSSGGRGGGGLESARVPFPTGTHSESIRAAGTVGGSLRALSVPSARASTSVGQDLPAAAPQRCPTWGNANGHSFGDSKERQRPEGPAGEDVPEQACEKHQWPASGDRPVRGGDAPWHHPTVSENRGRGDSPSVPGHQQALPADVGHPVGVSAALEAATPRDRTPSDSPTSAGEQVLCERELRGPPLRSPAQPSLQAAGSASPGLGSDRPTSFSKHPKPTPEAPRRVAATGATESRNAPAAGNVPNPVNSAAREQHPVHEGESRPLPTHRSLAAPALIRAASPPPGSVPPGPWRPLLGAAQSGACGGSGQRRPETPQALATVPLEAGPCTSAVAESEASAAGGGRRAAAAAGSPWGGDTTPAPGGAHLTPQGRAAVGPLPSHPENQQTEEDKHVPPKDQVPPGAGAPRQPPSPGAAAGGQRVGGAPHKSPDPQAHEPPASLTRNGVREGVEVGDRRQPRAGLGAPEEEAAGPMGLDGPPEKGVALWGQKPGSRAAKEGQTRPGELEGGRAAEVGTGHQGSEKGSEHAPGQRARRAENPPRGHGAQAGKNKAPSPAKKPGRPAQAQAGRMAPRISVGPPDSSSEAVPTVGASGRSQGPAPRGSQAEPGTPHQGGESQPTVGGSQRSSGPEPVPGSAVPAPKPAGRETPWAPAQEGPPKTPEAGSGASERERRRRLAHFAKYRAQSFGDQRSFDLSFRPTVIRANDTFELPK
ncbi:uncharacterized protein [Callorhinus ursinus]|uniref:uncharacterized protein isoform X2 n=1 Tax=Callorhinus ursinus TaxID=34884 RepID=UPI003CD04673